VRQYGYSRSEFLRMTIRDIRHSSRLSARPRDKLRNPAEKPIGSKELECSAIRIMEVDVCPRWILDCLGIHDRMQQHAFSHGSSQQRAHWLEQGFQSGQSASIEV
jgi:hypothetical protein